MKLILAAFILTSSLAHAQDCMYEEIKENKTTYVYPVYQANVTYYFSKSDKNAKAMVQWELNQDKTISCFNAAKNSTKNKVIIPTVFASQVRLKVFGASEFSEIEIYPTANGHWFGSTSVNVAYSLKNKIIEAKNSNLAMVKFDADTKMRLKIVEKKNYGKFDCTDKEEGAGVLRLFERLGAFKKVAESLKGANTEDVLQTFLGTCVQFNSVDAESFAEFNDAQKLNSKILKNQIEISGNVEKQILFDLPAVSAQEITILDV